MFRYCLYKFGQFCVNILPLRLSYTIAVFISDLHYRFSVHDKKAVRENLKLILLDHADLEADVRKVFHNFGIYLVDFFRMEKSLNKDFIKKYVKFHHLERINEALSHGKGGIMLTGHIGNWELGAAVLSRLGYKILVIALSHKERAVNDLFDHQRQVHGISVVTPDVAGQKCGAALQANNLVGILADRDFTNHGLVQDFFGKPTSIPKGAALFACKHNAPIIPVTFTRAEDGLYDLKIWDIIYPDESFDREKPGQAWRDIHLQYTKLLEKMIFKYPTQWLMFRKFWIS